MVKILKYDNPDHKTKLQTRHIQVMVKSRRQINNTGYQKKCHLCHVPHLSKLYLVQKYGGRYFEKVLFINLFYFVVSIGITACSIIMDIALVIKTT